jgi:hypothetical protein
VDQRLAGLELALEVAETSLGDRAHAFEYAERGLREAVGHVDPQPWLKHTERLAESTGRQAEQVSLLCEVMPSLFDGELQLGVTLRIAELARHRLANRTSRANTAGARPPSGRAHRLGALSRS